LATFFAMQNNTELLYNLWYVAASGRELKCGKTQAVTLLGQQVLLGRTSDGEVFALRDFCPHRGMPLRYGSFDGQTIECCYHGWCFNKDGQCTSIPSLTPEDTVDITRIKAQRFPCREIDGNIWVFVFAPKTRLPDMLPEIPPAPAPMVCGYTHIESVLFPCSIDHAVIGLMDPSHGPFVHASWWWRSRRSMHQKQKKFAPFGMGFRMLSHAPSSNSRAYRILGGGERTTEISFQLPGLRTEHITIGRHRIILLTALTPVDETHTMLHQFAYSTIPLLNWLMPLLKPFGKAFIKQDLDVVEKQQEGLRGNHPSLMLLGDADAQALWYYKLKRDFLEAQAQDRPFENRIPEKTLRWRS
jgi:phenylpropionate dioxygenase-like ring-hydroxylating dioxygenase large terminal subunit